uniref:Uncharacterized protein n=1 Tax=Melanopsichium pennsylvanicum 4 TaxID=1398559 RepID=A0A077QQE0_9BASI|nr:uncharacterized protein BN887_06022 [Melanopsichium pennsylvanicum 4]
MTSSGTEEPRKLVASSANAALLGIQYPWRCQFFSGPSLAFFLTGDTFTRASCDMFLAVTSSSTAAGSINNTGQRSSKVGARSKPGGGASAAHAKPLLFP